MTDPKPLTTDQLNEIAARAAAATPGPWEEHTEYGPHFYAYLRGPYLRGVGTLNFGDGEDAAADREFVKHAHGDVDALLAEVRRLQAERDAFRNQRNAVFETNRRLTAEVEEAGQARLRAENEVRTLWRSHREEHPTAGELPAAEGAQR